MNVSQQRDPRQWAKWRASGAVRKPPKPILVVPPEPQTDVVFDDGFNQPPFPIQVLKPRRVVFPLFQVVSNPSIPLALIKERRFDLIDRAQEMTSIERGDADRLVREWAREKSRRDEINLVRRVLEGMLDVLKGDPCLM